MLQKNIYLLYPAGYSGSYVNWALLMADVDLRLATTVNPINTVASKQFGGVGTVHMQSRIPTHQGLMQHLNWRIYNNNSDPHIYLINTSYPGPMSTAEIAISEICQHDSDGVFIHIHDNNEYDVRAYGDINCITKWPSYMAAISHVNKQFPQSLDFDPFDCADNIQFRNQVVYNSGLLTNTGPLIINELNNRIQANNTWLSVRNMLQPHEVNSATYNMHQPELTNRIFSLSCADIASPKFLPGLADILAHSGASSEYSMDFVNKNHYKYIDAQPNLQWFPSIQYWRTTGKLTNYLLSHSIIQAWLIINIFAARSNIAWGEVEWAQMSTLEINNMHRFGCY